MTMRQRYVPPPNPELAFPSGDRALCLDIGSRYISAGFAGEDAPRIRFSTVLSEVTGSSSPIIGSDVMQNENNADISFGSLSWPAQKGEIVDWDKMEKIWGYIWNHPKLETASDAQPVLVSEVAGNGKENRRQLAEILFEKYSVPELYFGLQPVLAMYSTGKTSGLVLDIGHQLIQSVPMYEGFALDHAVMRHDLGGLDLTMALRTILMDKCQRIGNPDLIQFATVQGFRFVELIKENMGGVAMDFSHAQRTADDELYVLPDRTRINVGAERYFCGEALFAPSMIQKEVPGIHEIIYSSYDKCDGHVRKLIEKNIVLAGGSSKFAGITSRLTHELSQLIHSDQSLLIDAPREREIACWVGGSIVASLPTFSQLLISKQKYDEDGENIIFSQCF